MKRLAPSLSSTATAGTLSDSLQRAAHRHRALEGQVEILRRIAAVAHRPIVDQRFGMDEAVLEAEPVDERLERRAGRAQRRASCRPGRRGARRNSPASRRARSTSPVALSTARMATEMSARARGRARAQGLRGSSAAARRW